MLKIRTGGAAAVVLAAVSCAHAQDTAYLPVPLAENGNVRLEEPPPSGYSAPLPSERPLLLNGIPFAKSIKPWAWNSHQAAVANESMMISQSLGGLRPDAIVTQINTYWGQPESPAGQITIVLANGEVQERVLIGGVHVRDYNNATYTNTIDPEWASAALEWMGPDSYQRRMDIQRWPLNLPENVGVIEVRFEDFGAQYVSRLIVGGLTLEFTADCNGDGIVDYGQILDGTYADEDGNGVPDCCKASCPGDLNGDNRVDSADLGLLIAAWNTDGSIVAGSDINEDGIVNAADLGLQIGNWGECGGCD